MESEGLSFAQGNYNGASASVWRGSNAAPEWGTVADSIYSSIPPSSPSIPNSSVFASFLPLHPLTAFGVLQRKREDKRARAWYNCGSGGTDKELIT